MVLSRSILWSLGDSFRLRNVCGTEITPHLHFKSSLTTRKMKNKENDTARSQGLCKKRNKLTGFLTRKAARRYMFINTYQKKTTR